MHFTSRPLGFRPLKSIVSGRTLGCLLAVLSAPLALYGGTTPSTPPPIENATNNTPAAKTGKKPEKYDIDHIGQRGIGRGFNLYSVKREHELGQSLAASFDRTTRVIHDPVVNDYINNLPQKIVRYSDADIPFTVKVIDSGDVPRAYGLPGGFLYVDSALILSADGEAELAAVMAHEIAHVAARHMTRQLTKAQLAGLMALPLDIMLGGWTGLGAQQAAGAGLPMMLLEFDRKDEEEADYLGVQYMYAAGYDPNGVISIFEKMESLERARPGVMARVFSTHPMDDRRIENAQKEIQAILPPRPEYIVTTSEYRAVRERLIKHEDERAKPHHDQPGHPAIRRRELKQDASGRSIPVPRTSPRSAIPSL